MNLEELLEKATQLKGKTVAVAAAEDSEVIEAVVEALKHRLGQFILFGDQETITHLLKQKNPALINDDRIKVNHVCSSSLAAEYAVKAIKNNEADVLMKGNIQTATLLKAVLNKEYGLRMNKILSHIAVFEVTGYNRLIMIADSAMNMNPDLQQKAEIISNSVAIAQKIGVEIPKVAVIATVEVVNPAMQATMDAAVLTQMNRRGQIPGCLVDGPLALDNAVSLKASEHKKIQSDVAGQADILLVPSLEVGNSLYKSLVYFANAKVAGIIAGAKAPIVLTSRADSAESKLYSLALALCSSK